MSRLHKSSLAIYVCVYYVFTSFFSLVLLWSAPALLHSEPPMSSYNLYCLPAILTPWQGLSGARRDPQHAQCNAMMFTPAARVDSDIGLRGRRCTRGINCMQHAVVAHLVSFSLRCNVSAYTCWLLAHSQRLRYLLNNHYCHGTYSLSLSDHHHRLQPQLENSCTRHAWW